VDQSNAHGIEPPGGGLLNCTRGRVARQPGCAAYDGAAISGYVAPQLVGLLREMTGNYVVPLLGMGALMLLAGLLVPLAGRVRIGVMTPALARARD
jgi:hypothetical protein